MKLENVKSLGIMGGGFMGSGITQTVALAGYKVICRDLTSEIIEKTRDTIINGRFGFKRGVERGKLTQEQMDKALANITPTTKVEDLKNCDVIIEAIGGGPGGELENKDTKLKVFAELDKAIKKEAIFASNTSRYTIADMAAVTKRKDKVIGMHWLSPANLMKVVEIIWTADNSEATIQFIEGLCRKCGKTSVRVKDVPGDTGFVGNRIFYAAGREALKIVEEGIASSKDIETVMVLGFQWPVGPLGMRQGIRADWGQKKSTGPKVNSHH